MPIDTQPAEVADHALLDLAPPTEDLVEEVLAGLNEHPKTLPSTFFYDERGSILFEQICELEEYYPTRTELSILRRDGQEMAQRIGANALVIEPGSGAGTKSRLLLETLESPAGYVPMDICAEPVLRSTAELREAFPSLPIMPVRADYYQRFDPPMPAGEQPSRRLIFFPGSTLGNLSPSEADALLRRMAELCGPEGLMLIGIDLIKAPQRMIAAYSDSQGVTAAFNLNLLQRINDEAEGGFDLDRFSHQAVWNPSRSRMESHLVSQADQTVSVADQTFTFTEGESIHTECSYKYTLNSFANLARTFDIGRVWTDPQADFAVVLLTPSNGQIT